MKILKWTTVILLVLITGFVIAVYARYDRKFEAAFPPIHASKDSAVIARGKYLVYGAAHCGFCHAPAADFNKIDKGEEVSLCGGRDFELPFGIVHTPNITPDDETGIGKLKDEEIARALRYGVHHTGRAIPDFMPFYTISENDLTAIISYLRVTPPVKNYRPPHEWNFLGKAILAFAIKPMGDGKFAEAPAIDTTTEYGKYLAESVANCRGCHTLRDMKTGAYLNDYYAGGNPMEVFDDKGMVIKGQHLVTPNLTGDAETGRITSWGQQQFVNRFKQGRLIPGSPMPWGPFSRLSETEIIALYKYLHTVHGVKNETPAGVQKGDPS